jgi:teichuronic acid biosynthesis glycosyltransferase TuaC
MASVQAPPPSLFSMNMNILVVSSYPDENRPHSSVFVYHLVQQLTAQPATVEVISPTSWWKPRHRLITGPGHYLYGNEEATILRPRYFDFPNRVRIGAYTLGRFNTVTYSHAVAGVLPLLQRKPDIVYAHFLYRAGPGALTAARYFGVPAVVALGESNLAKHERIYTKRHVRRTIDGFSGIISVSQVNKRYCMDELGVPEDRIVVLPNAVDRDIYFPRDKMLMREKHNLPRDGHIIAFTGHFIERKGPLRVLSALERLPDDVYGVFLGSGPQKPKGGKVLFADSVPPYQVPELLSASDVFVLPTLNEGSCNAIAEAMACGLPVVSSDIEAVREQVDEDSGILVDPNSIDDIVAGVEYVLYNSGPERWSQRRDSEGVVFGLKERTARIQAFLAQYSGSN